MNISRLRILKAFVSNWKSFPHIENREFAEWTEFDDINIFIGPNSHGKTNFVNALRLILHGSSDYGGVAKHHTEKITESDCNKASPKQYITINIEILLDSEKLELINSYSAAEFNRKVSECELPDSRIRDKFFPLGTNRPIHALGKQCSSYAKEKKNWELIKANWPSIKMDMLKFFEIDLGTKPPSDPGKADDYLKDLTDRNGVPFLETGSGVLAALYFVMEINKYANLCSVFLFEEPEVHMHPLLCTQQ